MKSDKKEFYGMRKEFYSHKLIWHDFLVSLCIETDISFFLVALDQTKIKPAHARFSAFASTKPLLLCLSLSCRRTYLIKLLNSDYLEFSIHQGEGRTCVRVIPLASERRPIILITCMGQ
jgi:hypothetical protein